MEVKGSVLRSVVTLKVVFPYLIKIIKYGKTTFKRISKIIIQVELIYMVRNQKISFVGFYCQLGLFTTQKLLSPFLAVSGMCQSLKIWGGTQPPLPAAPSDLPKSGGAYAPPVPPLPLTHAWVLSERGVYTERVRYLIMVILTEH